MNVRAIPPSLRVFPLIRPGSDRFFLLGSAFEVEIAGMKVQTAPVIPGDAFDILSLTTNQELQNQGITDSTDSLNPEAFGLERLYYFYEGERHSFAFDWKEVRLTEQPQDNYRMLYVRKDIEVVHKGKTLVVNFTARANIETGLFQFHVWGWEEKDTEKSLEPEVIYTQGADFHIERINLNRVPRE